MTHGEIDGLNLLLKEVKLVNGFIPQENFILMKMIKESKLEMMQDFITTSVKAIQMEYIVKNSRCILLVEENFLPS